MFSEVEWRGLIVKELIVRGLSKIVFVLMIVVRIGIVKLFLYKIIKQIKKYKNIKL